MPGTRKLGKPTDQRMAMLRQQVTDLMTYGKITTTVTRAKELKPLADKMITLGKRNTLASRRQALAFMTKEDAVTRVFTILAPIYAERNGGYTRVVRLGARRGDAAEEAIIALVDEDKIAAADAEAEKARKEEERAAKKTKKAE
jgi:large subunit ribosomal protein L17